METLAATVFWASALAVLYVYAGYPLLLTAWSRLRGRPFRSGDWTPTVDVLIAAHDEAEHIEDKVNACLRLDYPPDRLRVVVSVDGPDDGTDRIVARLARHPRVHACISADRGGKAEAINRAIPHLRGEVVVLADARQPLATDAVRWLTAALADPEVGSVSGELVLLDEEGRESAEGVGVYWRYEKALRRMESAVHSMLGATGALYAMRRSALSPLPAGTILDDMLIPLRTVLGGRRAVLEPRARVFDRVADPEWEYRRKVRTLTGNYQLIGLMPELLDPRRNPVFVQFVSHKLGRLAVPWLLAALLGASALLSLQPGAVFYRLALVTQVVFYGLAVLVPMLLGGEAPPASAGTRIAHFPVDERRTPRTEGGESDVLPARVASGGGRS